jgi:hypothetical protein
MEICEENGVIVIRGQVRALLDQKIQMLGVWEGETFKLKKSRVTALLPLLESKGVRWEEKLLGLAEGLKSGASLELTIPGDSFKGTLLPYQQKGVDWLNFLYRWGFSGLLADEMGLGKTQDKFAGFDRGASFPPF